MKVFKKLMKASTLINKHLSQLQKHPEKVPLPVRGSTHLLLLVRAGGRVSIAIVVEAVEGVVGVVEHVCAGTEERGSSRVTLDQAQQQQPVLLLCSAAELCSAS